MTAAPEVQPESSGNPFADASPAQVRAALVPEDAVRFDRQWRAAMATATEALDLTGVHDVLESWRRVAWLTSARGAEGYRRILARAEETLRTGEQPPGAVSLEEIRLRIGHRLG
jgi:hypothetical protein